MSETQAKKALVTHKKNNVEASRTRKKNNDEASRTRKKNTMKL
jgi:hypothetical protein